jgi:hypothetical protein
MTPIEQEVMRVNASMLEIAIMVDKKLPYRWGYIVLTFPFGADGRMLYVSNAQRKDVVRALYEFIERTKRQWGKDVPDESAAAEDEQLGRALQQVAELKHEIAKLKAKS